jgi:hypothetical protein
MPGMLGDPDVLNVWRKDTDEERLSQIGTNIVELINETRDGAGGSPGWQQRVPQTPINSEGQIKGHS